MYPAILWSALLSGVLSVLYAVSVLLSHHRELEGLDPPPAPPDLQPRVLPVSLAVGAAVAIVLILLGLQKAGIFSRGQGLAPGLCVGAAAAVVIGVLLHLLHRAASFRRASEDDRLAHGKVVALARLSLGTTTALLGMSALSCALALLVCKQDVVIGLIGYALGTVAVLGVSCLLDASSGAGWVWSLEVYVMAATVVALCAAFGHLHFGGLDAGKWRMLPAALVGVGGLGAAVCSPLLQLRSVASKTCESRLVCAAIPGVIVLLLVKILGSKGLHEPGLMMALVMGLAATVAVLLAGMALPGDRADDHAASTQTMGLCALVVLLACALNMRLMGGYGAGLALVLMVSTLAYGLVAGDEERERLPLTGPMALALCMGVFFLLYRLFIERYPTVQYVELGVHYSFVTLVGGALLPALVAAYQARTSSRVAHTAPSWLCVVRILLLGAVLAALPGALLALWSYKAVIGLIVGVLIGLAYLGMLPSGTPADDRGRGGLLIVFIGLGLLCVQLPGHFSEWAELARDVRIRIAIWLGVAAVVWFVVDALILARTAKEAEASCTPSA